MMKNLDNRIVKLEKRTASVDIDKWQNTPVELMPDWVLINIILDRPVSPEEAAVLDEDEGFWAEIEARVASADGASPRSVE